MATSTSSAGRYTARGAVLTAMICGVLAAHALPADELASLRSENARLRAELQNLRQNTTPTKTPPATQNLRGSKPNIVILFGDGPCTF